MHKYVVIGQNCWGADNDLSKAKRKFKAQGGRLTRGYTILEFDAQSEFTGIDGMGYVLYRGNEPHAVNIKPTVREAI